jgi:hypothetical protein
MAKLAQSPPQTSTFASVREQDSFLTFPHCSGSSKSVQLAMLLFEKGNRIQAHFQSQQKVRLSGEEGNLHE